MASPVVLNHLSFAWPDGQMALSDLTAVFGTGRTGLVGANGSGKTTPLKPVVGQLTPTAGSVVVAGCRLVGGERFRVAMARLLLAEPPADLLILDEPTNSLDLASVDQLVEALAAYRGAILVVSHDRVFVDRVGVGLRLELVGGPGQRRLTVLPLAP